MGQREIHAGSISYSSVFIIVFLLLQLVSAKVAQSELFPHGNGNDQEFAFGDDAFLRIDLQVPFNFFNASYNSTFISGNGQVSFGQGITAFTPACSPSTTPMIMAYWADSIHDSDTLLLHQQTTNRTLLRKAGADVLSAFPHLRGISLTWMLIVTWKNVPFYGSSSTCDGRSKRNTYQLILTSDGYHSFALMYYNKIEWTSGTASKGNCEGLGGNPAKAGFDYGDGTTLYTVLGSCSDSIINITQSSNINQPGKWVFRIDANLETATCDTFDSSQQKLKLSPNMVSYVGLQTLKLEGPCLKQGANASCIFHDLNMSAPLDIAVEGLISPDLKSVSCPIPFFQQVGRKKVDLQIIYERNDSNPGAEKDGANREIQIYSGFLYVLHEDSVGEYLEFSLERPDDENDNKTIILNAKWDPNFFQDGSDSEPHGRDKRSVMSGLLVDILLQVHDGHDWVKVGVLERSVPNTGSFRGNIQLKVLETFKKAKDFVTPVIVMVKNELVPSAWNQVKKLGSKAFLTLIQLSEYVPLFAIWPCELWALGTSPPPTDTRICPPTIQQADEDDNFQDDGAGEMLPGFHPGGHRSKRQAVPSDSGAGSQCVYDKDGNLMTGPPGGGTLDRYSPNYNVPLHFFFDVVPYVLCCNLSRHWVDELSAASSCRTYYDKRPSDDGTGYPARRVTMAAGDPHITTFDGLSYTFNGVGEFWMVRFQDGDNLRFKMQARMEQYVNQQGKTMNASVFTAVAMEEERNGERVKIQVSYSDQKIFVVLDDEPVDVESEEISGELTLRHKSSSVTIKSTEEVVVTFSSSFSFRFSTIGPNEVGLNIIGSANSNLMNVTEGLMGNFDGDPENDMRIPDGTILPSNSTPQTIHYDFGFKWMIQEGESIFTYPPGKSYKDYWNPNFLPNFLTLDISTLPQSVIDTCGEHKDCMFDYVTTGSSSFANGTRSAAVIFEKVVEVTKTEVKMCKPLQKPENGYLKLTNLIAGVGQTEIHCDPEFQLKNGPVNCSCSSGADWDCNGNPSATCVPPETQIEELPPLYCDTPPKPVFGHIIGTDYSLGSVIQLECDSEKYSIFWRNCNFNGPGGICREFCNVTYTCVPTETSLENGTTTVKAVWSGYGGDIEHVGCLSRFVANIAQFARGTTLVIHAATQGKLVPHLGDRGNKPYLIGC